MAPSANSATGEAAPASMSTARISGAGGSRPAADDSVPSAMAQGSGLVNMPRSARDTAAPTGWPVAGRPAGAAAPSCDSAMHSELVTTMSSASATMAGAAAAWPNSAISSGTPMKPLFGKAATSAPKAASLQPSAWRRATPAASATTATVPAR